MPDGLDKAREYFDSGRYVEAVAAWRELAEHGSADAQYNLGVCCESGQGVVQRYKTAAEWYRKAAEQGHADAQYNLGVCYANGCGVAQSYKNAVKWYRKAVEQGDENAIDALSKWVVES